MVSCQVMIVLDAVALHDGGGANGDRLQGVLVTKGA